MSEMGKRLGKLKGRGFDELRVRGSQALAALAERRGWSSHTKLPADETMLAMLDPAHCEFEPSSADELLELFRRRPELRFFSSFQNRQETLRALKSRWPNAEAKIVARAQQIVGGRFDLLGFRNLSFGSDIDWHLEPVSGKRTSLLHWSRLDFLDSELAGDKKIVWELNRHQYFITLGQAYWLTADETYAQTFVSHLTSWMDQNPPKMGINWASSLEVSFRSISWLWALQFFKDSPALTPHVFTRALKFLYLNARHLETYLSTYFSPNTHLTGEALGLFYLGSLWPELKLADRWQTKGQGILLAQLAEHVKPDGVYFEQASYYHRYSSDFYLHFLILSQANAESLPLKVEEKLSLLLDHLMYITRPDGTTPMFGDDDGGRLMMLDSRVGNDFRTPLATGAALCKRADYKWVAGEAAEETLWLLGPAGLQEFDQLPAKEPTQQSVGFADGGYYVMRDGWTPTSNYLLFDCGPHGWNNCGHAHADALSFEISASGHPLLIDPGTHTYTGSKELRDWFRSSFAHNTLTVDGQSSSIADGPFSWKTVANAEKLSWINRERFDFAAGQHDGYSRLAAPATHKRSILFLKEDYWLLCDDITSESEHQYDLWFHLDTHLKVGSDSDGAVAIETLAGETILKLYAFAPGGHWHREEGWVSHCYGQKERAPVCVFSARARTEKFVTFMLPVKAKSPAHRVRALEAIGGRAFEVVAENAIDIVMIRAGKKVETARLASDFDFTWARFSTSGEPLPEELVLVGGQRMQLDGREILRSESRINYLAACRRGDQFRVETDDGSLDLSLPIDDLEAMFADSNRQSSV